MLIYFVMKHITPTQCFTHKHFIYQRSNWQTHTCTHTIDIQWSIIHF